MKYHAPAWLLLAALSLSPMAKAQPVGAPRFSLIEGLTGPNLALERVGRGRDYVGVVRSRKAGPAPLAIWLPAYPHITEEEKIDTNWLPTFLHDKGFSFGLVGRPRRAGDGPAYAAYLAESIAAIVRHAEEENFDVSNIILMGKGWGGHFAALLAIDPTYLETAGVDPSSIGAAVIFEGAGLDLKADAAAASTYRRRQLERFAGDGPGALEKLSPALRGPAPHRPRFLFQIVETDRRSRERIERAAAGLAARGSDVDIDLIRQTRWDVMQSYVGHHQNPDSRRLVEYLWTLAR